MNFDQTFYSNLRETEDPGSGSPAGNQTNNPALVEQAWKEYQAAIEQTRIAKEKLSDYKSNTVATLNNLYLFYKAQGNPDPAKMAKKVVDAAVKQLTKSANDAIAYEEAKRQSYISISAANNIPTYSTVATQQLNAQTELGEVQSLLNQQAQEMMDQIKDATGLSTPALVAIGVVVLAIILFLVFRK